jgi:membrane-associated protease RseP (regulator of RpoE activity)
VEIKARYLKARGGGGAGKTILYCPKALECPHTRDKECRLNFDIQDIIKTSFIFYSFLKFLMLFLMFISFYSFLFF